MKENILQTANGLLNQNGVEYISLREISAKLKISDGHLRYYFKTKEDLLLAIHKKMTIEIDEIASNEEAHKNLINLLRQTFRVMYKYTWVFTEPTMTFKKYKKLSNKHKMLINGWEKQFFNEFKQFEQKDFFSKKLDKGFLSILYEQFLIITENWIKYANRKKQVISLEESLNFYTAVSISIFLPYFNNKLQDEITNWIKQIRII